MKENERASLFTMRDCWIGGGSALNLAPESWKTLLSSPDEEENERCLLSIAGQALDVAFRPALPKELEERTPLPHLALPPLPEDLRPLFRLAVKQMQDSNHTAKLLKLMSISGFSAHPLDWMPTASDEASPEIYAPWIDWVSSSTGLQQANPDKLTIETWDDFYPAARKNILRALRFKDPDAAREMIAAKAGQEPAERRLAIIDLLRIRLGENDTPYLESLSTDRSGKVRQLASQFLARLGHIDNSREDKKTELQELADFLSKEKKGIILSRKMIIRAKKLKSYQQENRRRELLESFAFLDIAQMLSMSEEELVEGWQFDNHNSDQVFVAMVARSAKDENVEQLTNRLLENRQFHLVTSLLPRLEQSWHRKILNTLLTETRESLWHFFSLNLPDLISYEDFMKSKFYKDLIKELKQIDDAKRTYLLQQFNLLGLMITPEAAKAVLEAIISAGVFAADPAISTLRFSAALGAIHKGQTA